MNVRSVALAVALLTLAATALAAAGCGSGPGSVGATATSAVSPAGTPVSQPSNSTTPKPSGANLAGGVKGAPIPSGWVKRAQSSIHDGGLHVRFTSDSSVLNVQTGYSSMLAASGWAIAKDSGAGSPSNGARLAATGPGGRFLTLALRHSGGQTTIDLAVWPRRPSTTRY